MTRSIMAPFGNFSKEGAAISRLLAGYSNIELSLFHAVHVASGDFDAALRKVFGVRSQSKRISAAEELGLPAYQRLKLNAEFKEALCVMRYCLKIRNQYAHWIYWDDLSGKLAFANVEDLTKYKGKLKDLVELEAHHVDASLLAAQEAYFVYADDLLLWVNYEGQFKQGKLGKAGHNPKNKPERVVPPKLRLCTA